MATSTTFQQTQQLIPVFNGENYDFWSIKMRTMLMSRDLWEVVSKGKDDFALEAATVAGSEKKRKEIIMKDMSALHILQMAVTDSMFPSIALAISSKEAWDLLQAQFQGSPRVRAIKRHNLSREFEMQQMEENEEVKAFADRLVGISNQLGLFGETKEDHEIASKILFSLPPRYRDIFDVIVGTKDLETLTVRELVDSLQAYELRLAYGFDTSTEDAFGGNGSMQKKGSDGNQKNGAKKKTNRKKKGGCFQDEQTKRESSGNGKGVKQCLKCQKFGHYAYECRSSQIAAVQTNHQMEKEEQEEEDLLFTNLYGTPPKENGIWVVSTACPNHMTNDPNLFVNLDRSIKKPFRSLDGEVVWAAGKGDVRISTKKGHKILKDVFYVQNLRKNLLSVGQMATNGYNTQFGGGRCMIYDAASGKNIVDIKVEKGLFQVGTDNSQSEEFTFESCSLYPY